MRSATQKANLEKWCTELESGQYKQTTSKLHDNVGYCCLGVACNIISPLWNFCTDSFYQHSSGSIYYLNQSQLDFYGLSYDDMDNLAGMNDLGKSFKEIAQFIRKQYIGEL